MGDRMLALVAELADGWEASYLSPNAFAGKLKRLTEHCEALGRDVGQIRRSVEVDVVVVSKSTDLELAVRHFLRSRSLPDDHTLLETALVGHPSQCRDRILRYREAGVTDFTLSFADFPARGMLRLFAEQVRPHLPV
jgi:alkanesulfonate monooxygenase SsuD/methylene tetrahydromethanopterin reductase-like flavin-dependent oxidoreductase (luciferase family)